MEECDWALGTLAGHRVDQLEAVELEALQRLGQVLDLEAQMVESLAPGREEPRDARRVVGRHHQLDLRLADRQEGDRHVVLLDRQHELDREAQRVPPEPERGVDVRDDHGHVVHPAEPPDVFRNLGHGSRIGHLALLLRP
jgi:hypothetical protein